MLVKKAMEKLGGGSLQRFVQPVEQLGAEGKIPDGKEWPA